MERVTWNFMKIMRSESTIHVKSKADFFFCIKIFLPVFCKILNWVFCTWDLIEIPIIASTLLSLVTSNFKCVVLSFRRIASYDLRTTSSMVKHIRNKAITLEFKVSAFYRVSLSYFQFFLSMALAFRNSSIARSDFKLRDDW